MAQIFNTAGTYLGDSEEIELQMGETTTEEESLSNELIRSHTPLQIEPIKNEQPLPNQLRNLITNKGNK